VGVIELEGHEKEKVIYFMISSGKIVGSGKDDEG